MYKHRYSDHEEIKWWGSYGASIIGLARWRGEEVAHPKSVPVTLYTGVTQAHLHTTGDS